MAKAAKKQKLSWAGEVLTVEFPSLKKSLVVDVSKYSDDVRHEAMLHGFKQKFGDAKSGMSAAEKYEDVKAIHANLLEGEWARTATPDMTPLICLAVSRIRSIPLEDVLEAAEKAGAEKVKEWGSKVKVKAEILQIRKERLEAEAADDDEEIEIEV